MPTITSYTTKCDLTQEHHRIVEAGWDGEGPAGIGTTTLVIATERHPTNSSASASARTEQLAVNLAVSQQGCPLPQGRSAVR
jgi:hypothetical protein